MKVVILQNHRVFGGPFSGLDVAVKCATDHGNEVHVVENSEPLPDWGYVHDSPNPEAKERWCFERWFTLCVWMKETRTLDVFHMDSDVLVFCNLAAVPKHTSCTLPMGSCFVTYSGVRLICAYILNTAKAASILCHLRHVADDTLLPPLFECLELTDLRDSGLVAGVWESEKLAAAKIIHCQGWNGAQMAELVAARSKKD